VNFAASLGDGERKIDDEAVEQGKKAQLAQALGGRGRRAHIDEEERRSSMRGW
jgi:hypothetical protein